MIFQDLPAGDSIWQEFLSLPFVAEAHCYSARVETFVTSEGPEGSSADVLMDHLRWLHAGLREGSAPSRAMVLELSVLAREEVSAGRWRRSSETVHVCALDEATAQLRILDGSQLRVDVAASGDCFFYDSASHQVSSYGFQCPLLYDKSFLLPIPAGGSSRLESERNRASRFTVSRDGGGVLELRREGAAGLRRMWFEPEGAGHALTAAATVASDGRSALISYEIPFDGTLAEFSLTRLTLAENEGWGSIQNVFVAGVQNPTSSSVAVFPQPVKSDLYPGIHSLVLERAAPFLTAENHLEITQRFARADGVEPASFAGLPSILLTVGLALLAAAALSSSRIKPRRLG